MKRHKSLIPLSQQHHDTLILAQLIKRNAPPYKGLPTEIEEKRKYTLEKFRQHIVPHFEAEELILIPFIVGRDKSIDILCKEIVTEHQKIADLVDEIRTEKNIEDNMNELGELLSSHIRKEERELFQKVQEVLSSKQLEKLAKELSHLNKSQNC